MKEFHLYDDDEEYIATIKISDELTACFEYQALETGDTFENILITTLYEQIKKDGG